jgi:hypothetical protein
MMRIWEEPLPGKIILLVSIAVCPIAWPFLLWGLGGCAVHQQ